jgi:NADPH2 dehydrogenase
MRMEDPKPTYEYLVKQLAERHPNLAFLHLVEPGVKGNVDCVALSGEVMLITCIISIF